LFASMSNSEQKNSMKNFALSEISRLSTTTEECRRKKTSLQIFCKTKALKNVPTRYHVISEQRKYLKNGLKDSSIFQ
jgi:hypothetical protein